MTRPPINEIAIGATFVAPGFGVVEYGLFFEKLRATYPTTVSQPPIVQASGGLQFTLPMLPRIFYQSADGSFVIQLQEDRLVSNWRRQRSEDEYPGFAVALSRFLAAWSTFREVVDSRLPSPLVQLRHEITYVNFVDNIFRDAIAGPIFRWETATWDGFLPEPTAKNVQYIFAFPQVDLQLTATTRPAVELSSGRHVTSFQIDGISLSMGEKGISWFETAHEMITHAFEDLLTPAALAYWRSL